MVEPLLEAEVHHAAHGIRDLRWLELDRAGYRLGRLVAEGDALEGADGRDLVDVSQREVQVDIRSGVRLRRQLLEERDRAIVGVVGDGHLPVFGAGREVLGVSRELCLEGSKLCRVCGQEGYQESQYTSHNLQVTTNNLAA